MLIVCSLWSMRQNGWRSEILEQPKCGVYYTKYADQGPRFDYDGAPTS